MSSLDVEEIKAFVPSKDYELSKNFYKQIGFMMASDFDGVAYFYHGNSSFLLQDFYKQEFATNLMMSLKVIDVDAWHENILKSGVVEKYKVKVSIPEIRPWGMKDFVLFDPCGVLWRIGQNI
jgi:uncharacterized glyoxalase superfamily protein PhnB